MCILSVSMCIWCGGLDSVKSKSSDSRQLVSCCEHGKSKLKVNSNATSCCHFQVQRGSRTNSMLTTAWRPLACLQNVFQIWHPATSRVSSAQSSTHAGLVRRWVTDVHLNLNCLHPNGPENWLTNHNDRPCLITRRRRWWCLRCGLGSGCSQVQS